MSQTFLYLVLLILSFLSVGSLVGVMILVGGMTHLNQRLSKVEKKIDNKRKKKKRRSRH